VHPVPDPLNFFFSVSAGNRTRASGSGAKNSDHETTEAVGVLVEGKENYSQCSSSKNTRGISAFNFNENLDNKYFIKGNNKMYVEERQLSRYSDGSILGGW
jgi:hypothetical protein